MEALHPSPPIDAVRERLASLWERTGDEMLSRLATGRYDGDQVAPQNDQETADWISTSLMNCYKNTGDPQVFALLYELNESSFLQAIEYRLRRTVSVLDACDVLQEVFLNIYRYPHRFIAEKADSFRNWGHRIVRNTLLKFLKGESRRARFTSLDEDLGQRPDAGARSPYLSAAEAEIAEVVDRAYLLYLNLYLVHFDRLSARERHALTMVEVEGRSYKDAAAELGIRLENLKMVIFRGRRKVLRGMSQTLSHLGRPSAMADHMPDVRMEGAKRVSRAAVRAGRQPDPTVGHAPFPEPFPEPAHSRHTSPFMPL